MLVLMLSMLPVTVVFAQDDTGSETTKAPEIKDVKGLRLQLVQHTQDPQNQHVKFELIAFSQITSDRVQITWNVTGSGRLVSDSKQTLSNIEVNKIYRLDADVLPQIQGTMEVSAKIEAFAADGTYLATARQIVGVYPSKEVYPLTTNYRIGQIVVFLRTADILGIVAIVGFLLLRIAYTQFRKWLTRAEPVSIEESEA